MYIYGTHTHSRERENNNNNIPSGYRLLLVVSLDSIPSFSFSSPKLRKKKEPPCGHARRNGKKETRPSGRIYDQTKQKERRKKNNSDSSAPVPPLSFIPNATPTRN
jgi:hypothetical protein